jgi:leader peptidase (prepilin peptidase)/N-methyltransferase
VGESAYAALLAAVVSGLLALATPRALAALPEPEEHEPRPGEPPKEPWVDLAALPGLAWKCALAAAVVGALVGWRLGLAWPLASWCALVPAGVALAVVDARTRFLPTRLIWPTYGVVLALVALGALLSGDPRLLLVPLAWSAGTFVVFYVLWWISPRSLGFGDVRLAALLGLALGQLGEGETVVGIYAGFVLGAVFGLLLRVVRILPKGVHIPFGPWMLAGALVGLWWGGPLWASIYG